MILALMKLYKIVNKKLIKHHNLIKNIEKGILDHVLEIVVPNLKKISLKIL